jgi:hypothetical protein
MTATEMFIWGASIVVMLVNFGLLRGILKQDSEQNRRDPDRVRRVIRSAPYHHLEALID